MNRNLDESQIRHFLKIDIPNSYRGETNFSCDLFRLIRKADPSEKCKLRSVYPEEVEAWDRYVRIDLFRHWEQLPEVGSIVQIGCKVMNAVAGSIGVVYEQYAIGGREPEGSRKGAGREPEGSRQELAGVGRSWQEPTGVGIIFYNGDYDGFSREDLDMCKVRHTGRISRRLSYYVFENVGRLKQDFERGVFSEAFEAEN